MCVTQTLVKTQDSGRLTHCAHRVAVGTTNDFLHFPAIIAAATVENSGETLSAEEVEVICGPPADDRDFIRSMFDGVYFDAEVRVFLDLAWSHIDGLSGARGGARGLRGG
ncbi:MAG: hypothetical protein ACT4NY_27820, partial [Pseudonocardiales bacterium]